MKSGDAVSSRMSRLGLPQQAEEGKIVRLKFSRAKYDATLLAATMISVWGVIVFLTLSLVLRIEHLPK
jgi:hypothetical protein